MQRWIMVLVAAVLAAGAAPAGEKTLMHCFAFGALEKASESDWREFTQATETLPAKIPGLTRVWVGKLRRPIVLAGPADPESNRQILAAGIGNDVTATVRRLEQHWGVCMEMADEATLKVYAKHPAHKAWVALYQKVGRSGSTSFDILGR